jgi:hypothetical protein
VALTQYRVDGGSWQTYSVPFTVSGDGQHVVNYQSKDIAGNWESPAKSIPVWIDTVSPGTSAQLSGTPGEDGWYLSQVRVTFSVSDPTPGSGVAVTHCRLDGGEWRTCNGHYDTQVQGAHTVWYYSCDVAGNCEPSDKRVSFKIDTLPPGTTYTLGGVREDGREWYRSEVTVTLSASDSGSGIARVQYAVDGGGWQTYTGPFGVAGDGVHIIAYQARDVAGNWEGKKQVTVKIDTTPPVIANPAPQNGAYQNDARPSIAVTLADGGARLDPASVSMALDGQVVTAGLTPLDSGGITYTLTYQPAQALLDGQHTVVVRVSDQAGCYGQYAWQFRVDPDPGRSHRAVERHADQPGCDHVDGEYRIWRMDEHYGVQSYADGRVHDGKRLLARAELAFAGGREPDFYTGAGCGRQHGRHGGGHHV